MTKLQASMKDKSAKGWRERKLYYRVGGCCKGCQSCGEIDPSRERTVWSEVLLRKVKVQHYTSGYNVFRSFSPKAIGWTFKCFDCQSIDVAAWGSTYDMHQEPRILPKSDLGAESRKEKGSTGRNPQIEYKRAMMMVSEVDEEMQNRARSTKVVLLPKERAPQQVRLSSRDIEIMALEKKIAELSEMLK